LLFLCRLPKNKRLANDSFAGLCEILHVITEVPSELDFHFDSGYSICQECRGLKDMHSLLNWLLEAVKVVGYPAIGNKPWSGF